jgi:5S rRNA maturation endonuclease (ribonuclease M5)
LGSFQALERLEPERAKSGQLVVFTDPDVAGRRVV